MSGIPLLFYAAFECSGLVPTLQSNLETGDYRIRQRGARAGAAGEAEAPGVSLHDHGCAYVAARHGGGPSGTAGRGAGGRGVRLAGGIGGVCEMGEAPV